MVQRKSERSPFLLIRRAGRNLSFFITGLLLIEFLDELVFGVREAAWPLVRSDLSLSYAEIGLLLGVPSIVGNLIEPVFGILGDTWNRRALILGGGVCFAVALFLTAVSWSFALLLIALIIFSPASGAFVNLSQAALMDADSSRHQQNMARWALAGSLGNVIGPLALGGALMLGAGWRELYGAMFALTLLLLVVVWRFPFATPSVSEGREGRRGFRDGIRHAIIALKRREVLRWLVLLEFADLTWDVLRGFLALYFVDVVGTNESQAALAVIVWTGIGLPGDLLLIPLLERVRGLTYLKFSALAVLFVFPVFLLADNMTLKLALLGLLGFVNAGWYSILKAQLYTAMPGQSGTVMTLGNVFGLLGGLMPLALGLVAEHYGLRVTMWLLLIGPFVVLIGLLRVPRERAG